MKKIKYIELVFENCEVCKLTPDMFKYLIVSGVKEDININCYQYENGEENTYKICEYFAITINKKGLKQEMWEGKLRKRLVESKDITAISIHYKNKEEIIYVEWNEENDFSNKYQTIRYVEEGIRLYISKESEGKE